MGRERKIGKGGRTRQSSKALAAARGNGERKEDREGGGRTRQSSKALGSEHTGLC